MVNITKNLSPLPAGRFGKSKKAATLQRHRRNAGKSGLEAERIRALNSLRSLRHKKKQAAEKSKETLFMSAAEKEQWIKNFVERETAGARQRLEEAEAALCREQERVKQEENHLGTGVPKKTLEEMLKEIGDDDNVANAEDEVDEETEYEEEEEVDEKGWVPGVVEKAEQQRIDAFRLKCMRMDEISRSGWEDAERYFRERDRRWALAGSSNGASTAAPAPEKAMKAQFVDAEPERSDLVPPPSSSAPPSHSLSTSAHDVDIGRQEGRKDPIKEGKA